MEVSPSEISSSRHSWEDVSGTPSACQLNPEEYNLEEHVNSLLARGMPLFTVSPGRIPKNNFKPAVDYKHKILNYSRKSKSLEELSRKFIMRFQGREGHILELDKVTFELNVERRRVYDIINILESLRVVRKIGKNKYFWCGLKQAVATIKSCLQEDGQAQIQNPKKKKSLEFFAAGFLRLFLHYKTAFSLEEAARQLIGNEDAVVIKTKIRRLYDIVNVFKSLGCVLKTTLDSHKPGVVWLGTDYLQGLIKKRDQQIEVLESQQTEKGGELTKTDHEEPGWADVRQAISHMLTPPLPKPMKMNPPTFNVLSLHDLLSIRPSGSLMQSPANITNMIQLQNSAFTFFRHPHNGPFV